jgi:hypothetical protein
MFPEVMRWAHAVAARVAAQRTTVKLNRPFNGFAHLKHSYLFGRTDQHDTALVTAHSAHEPSPGKRLDDLDQIALRHIVRQSDLTRLHYRPYRVAG